MDAPRPEKKVYKAQCHCARTKFTVALPPLETGQTKANKCNCSICTKNGYVLVYPLRTDVEFLAGEEELSAYVFGKKGKPHRFCAGCGTSILIDFGRVEGEDRKHLAVNVGRRHDYVFCVRG